MYSHFSLKSNIQSFLQLCAGGLFVLVEGMGIDIQRCGGLAVAENTRHRCHIVPPAIIRLAAVCRREWTFSSCGKQFFLRISLKRQVKVVGVMGSCAP